MQASEIPLKVPVPFASDSTLVTPVPLTDPGGGQISWQQGFTILNMLQEASGGTPPFGQNMNGVLQAISAWAWWQSAGGQVAYDPAFSAENGGYPQGAYVQAASGLGWWLCTLDNNTSDPDTAGIGWMFIPMELSYNGNPNGNVAGQAAVAAGTNIPASPPSQLWDYKNGTFWICTATGSAGTATWAPLTTLVPINPSVTGNTYNYTAADLGQMRVRSDSGGTMMDSLPSAATVVNGWWTSIFNGDATGSLTVTAPGSTKLNGVVAGSVFVPPGKSTTIGCDAAGNFWVRVFPLPQNFAPQEIYVNASGTYGPGAYIVDTSAGPITFEFESTPNLGDNYSIRDMFGTFASNPCTVNPNGNTVEEQAGNLPLDVAWYQFNFAFKSGDWSQV